MIHLLRAFDAARPYKGKSLADWFSKWVTMRETDLTKANASFLTVITTWVVRNFQERRKGGVPIGKLEKFAIPAPQKIDFTNAISSMVVSTFRKRGLLESDVQPTDTFRKLNDAFDRSSKIL